MTWHEIVSLARRLHQDASTNDVKPDDAALFVRLLLRFERQREQPVLPKKVGPS